MSFNLRGVPRESHCIGAGICALHKLDVISNLSNNYFFYGILCGKNDKGAPATMCNDAGCIYFNVPLKPSKHYTVSYGFLYNGDKLNLSVIDVKANKLVFTTSGLKEGSDFRYGYVPTFTLLGGEDQKVKLVTGSDIVEIPSCIGDIIRHWI